MPRIISFFLTAFVFVSFSNAQAIYVKYDEDCMERLEYASSSEGAAYVSYRLDLGEGRLVHLDVVKDTKKWERELKVKPIDCTGFLMDKEKVQRLNSGTDKVFIVRQTKTHFNITAVKKAVYIDNYRSGVEVVMNDAEFVLDMSNLVSNRNIAKPSSKMAVFLDGTINYQCIKGYIIKKMKNFNSDDFKEYILIPEIGLVEKRSVSKKGTLISGRVKLNKVNKLSFPETLTSVCDGIQASIYDGNLESGHAGRPPIEQEKGNGLTEKGADAIPESYETTPCGIVSKGHHFVNKGETLYSISRRYGVTVDQLKNWNGLRDNTISICQKLKVSPTTSSSNSASGNGGASVKGTEGKGHWTQNADIHIVRPGESVAALATMYGFTEERFRKMNNLDMYERIYPGQELHASDCACPSGESTTKGGPMPYEEEVEIVPTLTADGDPDVYFRPIKVHHVRSNETLFGIARQYDTTIDRVRELNGLATNAKLVRGQRLYVQ